MNIEKAKEIIISAINTVLEGKADITEDMQLSVVSHYLIQ